MISLMRILRLLALVTWVGGIIFFAFAVAPVAFAVLPDTHVAGTVVAGTLGVLNVIGLTCGVLLLLACTVLWSLSRTRADQRTSRLLAAELGMVLLMLLATAWIKWSIIPAMERDRIAAGGNIDAAPADNPARIGFERLHPVSEKLEGAALLLGLATVVLVALERGSTPPIAAR